MQARWSLWILAAVMAFGCQSDPGIGLFPSSQQRTGPHDLPVWNMQAGAHIGGRPKQIAALQRKPAACLFHEGTPAPSSGLHGGDISFRLHSSYVFTLRHRSAPGFIPGEKPPVSLVFPTEIEHYSCFRLYSGLKKKKNRNFLEDSFSCRKAP